MNKFWNLTVCLLYKFNKWIPMFCHEIRSTIFWLALLFIEISYSLEINLILRTFEKLLFNNKTSFIGNSSFMSMQSEPQTWHLFAFKCTWIWNWLSRMSYKFYLKKLNIDIQFCGCLNTQHQLHVSSVIMNNH